MKKLLILIASAALAAGFWWWSSPAPGPAPAASPMVEAAQALLAGLTPDQREKATFPFSDAERKNWNFTPISRKGLTWEEMNPDQRQLAGALLQQALSEQGYRKAREIMQLEEVLKRLEGRAADDRYRHPEVYYLSIFGEPSDEQPWGWRFEGHHISFNFSSVTGQLSVTPAFLGSNPAEVPSGPQKGKRVLAQEEDLARKLMAELTEVQRRKAVIAAEAPREIITGAEREVSLKKMEGLPYAEMTREQQVLLEQLIRVYLDNMKPRIAQHQWQRLETAGLNSLHFAWAGPLEKGHGHYYRIHGPTLLIEYDNTQNNANHIHTVWRDPSNDFGEDLLKKHYEESEHRH